MSKREEIEERTEELILPILEKNDFDLWDVEYVKEGSDYYLRCFIDKEGGITIDDCVLVSRELSDALDVHDYIEDAYVLEVSSPGLGRTLKKDKEFARCIGKAVEIRTYRAVDNRKEFQGVLSAFDKESITILIDGNNKAFARSEISLVKLVVDYDE